MNRKITKTMAEQASAIMKEKAYGRKIENATEDVNAAVEKLVRKYIPAPVIACVNEYSTYFGYSKYACIATTDGRATTSSYITGTLTFMIPSCSKYIKVNGMEYDALLKIDSKRKQLVEECDEFGDQVYNALVALRNEKAVEKELPEAIKYLVFPEVKAVPMPILTGLREVIGKIKDD